MQVSFINHGLVCLINFLEVKTLQGYLAHKKTPLPPRTAVGPQAEGYCRVLGGRCFL